MSTTSTTIDIAVIGAGAVGMAAAWRLQQALPDAIICVLEKEPQVAAHQTGHNSGVIHSGIYYKPGSYKAKLCIRGREQLVEFCQTNEVAHDVCGKLIVARNEAELTGLEKILRTGEANGLTGVRIVEQNEIKDIEPYCVGVRALFVPQTGIVDFPSVCRALALELERLSHGRSKVAYNTALQGITRNGEGYVLNTNQGTIRARYLVACAGLQSDRVARLDGLNPCVRIVGFRGDYYDLTPEGSKRVRNLIYPVPNPEFPFLGVHFTRMVAGGVECGPNAVFTFKREGYGKTDFSLRDTLEALGFGGTLKFMAKHWRHGLSEYKRAFSKKLFHREMSILVPSLQMDEMVVGRAGVRAMALDNAGKMVDDFAFADTDRSVHVLNAPSPAATACLAIGEEITQRFLPLYRG
jgi:(S)-2-hydroxyglutarate dehydrogenase